MTLDTSRLGDWAALPFFRDALPELESRFAQGGPFLPPAPRVFAALELTQPQDVRVLILGQDPYPTPGHAHGLAFSVEAQVRPLPRSLRNIYRELADDIGVTPENGDLRPWARQGVLLLNTALTVPAGAAGGHARLGWAPLVEQVLARIDDRPRAALLWGRPAQRLGARLTHPGHLKIETAHPSPLSAARGFFGSRPFSAVNSWLSARGEPAISWA